MFLKNIFLPNSRNQSIYLTNLFVLAMYISGAVSASTIIFSYFLETIIIGVFNAIKMACARKPNEQKEGFGKVGSILFFLVHYGGFVAIQSIFAFSFIAVAGDEPIEPFNLITNYTLLLHQENMWILVVSLFITHGYTFLMVFIKEDRFLEISPMEIMFAPYLRIFVQQFVVILSGFFLFFEQAAFAVVLLLVTRTAVDILILEMRSKSEALDYVTTHLQKPEEWDDETFKKYVKNMTE